jgi:hypothetical protein
VNRNFEGIPESFLIRKNGFQKNEYDWTSLGEMGIIRGVAPNKTGRIREREK